MTKTHPQKHRALTNKAQKQVKVPKPVETNISKLNSSSHEPVGVPRVQNSNPGDIPKPKKKGFFAKVGDWIMDHGLETLVTLGSALLVQPHISAQIVARNDVLTSKGYKALPEGTIPMGTILASIPIYPNFADSLQPGAVTRLSRKASTFLQYKFEESTIAFTPAAGALNNGQLGFFIASDPRYIITATGEEVIRLVHEFKGIVTQISQKASLPVPQKKDWLFVEDGHASDTRFTQQGVLWVIAYTDLFLGDGCNNSTTSLGDFSLDYNIKLKDDSIDGAHVSSVSNTPVAVYTHISDGSFLSNVVPASVAGMFAPPTVVVNNRVPPYCASEIVNNVGMERSVVAAMNAAPWSSNAGLFTAKQAGYYNFNYCGDGCYYNALANNQQVMVDSSIRVTFVPNGGAPNNIALPRTATWYQALTQVYNTSTFSITLHFEVGDAIYFSQATTLYDAKTGNTFGGTTVQSTNTVNLTITLLLHTSGSINSDLLLGLQNTNGLSFKKSLKSSSFIPNFKKDKEKEKNNQGNRRSSLQTAPQQDDDE